MNGTTAPAEPSLCCVIPAGWRQVQLPELLGVLGDAAGDRGIDAGPLAAFAEQTRAEGTVLTVIRVRETEAAIDVLTVALIPEAPGRSGSAGVSDRPAGDTSAVEGSAAGAAPPGSPFTTVQKVIGFMPLDLVGIVTGWSSAADAESLLTDPVESLAGSLTVEAAPAD